MQKEIGSIVIQNDTLQLNENSSIKLTNQQDNISKEEFVSLKN